MFIREVNDTVYTIFKNSKTLRINCKSEDFCTNLGEISVLLLKTYV